MVSAAFKRDIERETGWAWEQWVEWLDRTADPQWSHDGLKSHILDARPVAEAWAEWAALLYGQKLGRIPVGVTKDAGVQIGVRRTASADRAALWDALLSPEGLALWIGSVPEIRLERGFAFASPEGVACRLTVVEPPTKLRLTWKRPDWDTPSRLQWYLSPAAAGRTTVAVHQEMLEDVYLREAMRRHWEGVLQELFRLAAAA
ncbi:SRPBCC domain-containing protein [Paenibacillus sp.]|uniref:SRPBCC family protein n=1 Tax=Paenibacillus sp. TaxID=58172 RepID=UPI002D532E8F|nr:SRPBCC domain-containing protein [Paenibacillus sp.]HZG84342.1 SRPBCC domain-containing protein [Paenibacillus sp.]